MAAFQPRGLPRSRALLRHLRVLRPRRRHLRAGWRRCCWGADAAPLPERPRLLLAADAFAMLDTEVRGGPRAGRAAHRGAARPGRPGGGGGPAGFEPLYWAFRRIQGREAWEADGPIIERTACRSARASPSASPFPAMSPTRSSRPRTALAADFRERFARLVAPGRVMSCPTMPDVAPLLDEDEIRARQLSQPRAQPPVPVRPVGLPAGLDAARDAGSARRSGCRSSARPGPTSSLVRLATRIAAAA